MSNTNILWLVCNLFLFKLSGKKINWVDSFNWAETLSLKGLAEHQSGNKEVGYQLAKKGLKMDVASNIGYHVLGVIYRNDRAFHQAYKYFQTALYHDPKNEKVLRDLASVQLHLRDYEGHLKSRKALWRAKPDMRHNWVGYALASHLSGDYEFAHHLTKIIHESSLSDVEMPIDRWEVQNQHSELLLYQNFILRDSISNGVSAISGDDLEKTYQLALDDINASSPRILDKIHVREIIAELHLKAKKLDLAKQDYISLIDTNPDNITYHYGLLTSIAGVDGITLESIFTRNLDATGKPVRSLHENLSSVLSASIKADLGAVYADLQKKHPKSLVTQQMPLLHWLDGEAFQTAFGNYARPLLTKGVPSLWNSVKSLYKYPAHVKMIDSWIRGVITSLEKEKKFPGASSEEDPTTLLWAYYFLAQHECEEGLYEEALKTIEKAIEHSPTVMDVYLIKGKILSKAGDAVGAAEAVEKARSMDLADRNLNTLSVKYWLKACNTAKAQANMALFTKLDLSHYSNIFTMQVMWYESHKANANLALTTVDSASKTASGTASGSADNNTLALAMKDFHNTIEHYHEMNEDQFDFFNYAARYFTLSAFVRIVRMEDRLPGQQHYINAAKGLLKCYLRLDDAQRQVAFSPASFVYTDYAFDKVESKASGSAATSDGGASGSGAASGEGKKKAPPPKKKAGGDASGAAAASATTTSTKSWNSKLDRDPRGETLAKTKLPLQRAAIYAQHLASFAWTDIEAHALLVEYHIRTAQFSLALRSVTQLIALAPQHPSTLLAIVRLASSWSLSSNKKTPSAALNSIIDNQLSKLLDGKSLEAFIDAYIASSASSSYASRVAGTFPPTSLCLREVLGPLETGLPFSFFLFLVYIFSQTTQSKPVVNHRV